LQIDVEKHEKSVSSGSHIGGYGMELNIGEIVKLKKQHPCGSSEWEILRVGMDFRLKCLGCGHQIMIPRKQVEKNIKQVRKPD
jgi:Uncharacterized protein conserved in bacteria